MRETIAILLTLFALIGLMRTEQLVEKWLAAWWKRRKDPDGIRALARRRLGPPLKK